LKITSIAFTLALVAAFAAPVMAREKQITVYAKNFAFTPGTITLKVHQRAKLVFVSKQGTHGITIPDIGLNRIVNIGNKPTSVEVTPQRIGSFVARCAVYCGIGHGSMLLKVNVIK
jgi:cytochrome c oxidase subunit 2